MSASLVLFSSSEISNYQDQYNVCYRAFEKLKGDVDKFSAIMEQSILDRATDLSKKVAQLAGNLEWAINTRTRNLIVCSLFTPSGSVLRNESGIEDMPKLEEVKKMTEELKLKSDSLNQVVITRFKSPSFVV